MIHSPSPISDFHLPLILFHASVPAGFPSPAADHVEQQVDLNEHLMLNRDASFLFRVRGSSMVGVGIYPGDTVIVDRSITPRHNHIVLAVIDGEYTIKRLYSRDGSVKLIAENQSYPAIEFREEQTLTIWGVVTTNLRRLIDG